MNLERRIWLWMICGCVAVVLGIFAGIDRTSWQQNGSVLAQSSQSINAQIIGNVILYQFSQNGRPLDGLLLSLPLNQNLDHPLTFTVFVNSNENKRFIRSEMVVQALPAVVESEFPNAFAVLPRSRRILNDLLDLPNEATIPIRILMEDSSVIPAVTVTVQTLARKQHLDIGEVFDPAPGFTGGVAATPSTLHWSSILSFFQLPYVLAQGAPKVPVSHTGVPDLGGRKGKPNECVPLSFANSLRWLGKTHKFEDKLPGTDDALIDELAADVKWTKDGAKNEHIFPGKEAFTKRRGLQLQNKKIDGAVVEGKNDLWEKIVKELNDGEDVELIMDFKDSPRGTFTKSHAVTVVGADTANKGKRQMITIHDPATPKGNDTYEVDRNGQIIGYPFGKVYVNFIVSESFDPTVPTSTSTPTASPTPSTGPTNTPPPAPTETPSATPTTQHASGTPAVFPGP